MNELIQKLAEQADLDADSKLLMKGEFHPDWHDVRDSIFVKLLIDECVGVMEGVQTAKECSSAIKRHFGLEE
jgi:hypothetical protein